MKTKNFKKPIALFLAVMLCASLLFSLGTTAFAAEETMYGIGFVNASSLRLRSEPDANSATLVYAPRNDCVAVISKSGEWYKVNYNLQVGYMHQDYLKVLTARFPEAASTCVPAPPLPTGKWPSLPAARNATFSA